jgi:murein DD-endopeptidase MepM/ murein hydrolase activator NlpD
MQTRSPSSNPSCKDAARSRLARRSITPAGILAAVLLLGACPATDDQGGKQDTTTVAPASVATPPAALDSVSGVPAVPRDSTAAPVDSGNIQIAPAAPRRGDVVFAFADGIASALPRCVWKGAPLPCYSHGTGVLAIVPLSADEPAGTYTLSIDRPGGRINRQITVAERDFGRELIFLDSARYALIRKSADLARDARVIRATLSSETPERQWSGAWRDPIAGARGTGYGVERFYYRASDSSRSVSIPSTAKVRGSFGADTTAIAGSDAPGWRHSGVDIPARRSASVVAPASGTVAEVATFVLTGRTIFLDHGRGVHSAYFHLDTILVQKGDRVRQGRSIARVGDTGLATGPHLHYGIYVHGKDVDPAAWKQMPPFVLSASADSAARAKR